MFPALPRRLRAAVLLSASFSLLGAPGCASQTACGLPAESAPSNEIVLGADAPPEPQVAGLRPCMKDDPAGCGDPSAEQDNGAPRILSGRHYAVEVFPTDPSLGPSGAPVTLVVFSDFECPFCKRLEPVLEELREEYPTELRIVWKDHPLSMHPHALPAALLGREAYAKGGNALFWEVHDQLFANQSSMDTEYLKRLANAHGLPWPPRSHVSGMVDQSLAQAQELGVRSTPTSFVNGRAVVGTESFDAFAAIIDDELEMRRAAR